jgi:hypothetical protein
MKTQLRNITPAIAEELLKLNHSNRPLKQKSINHYAKEMKSGNWRSTGEGIKVSKNNRLLDGQHRLHAVVKSGVTVEMLVISDLEDDIFNVLDTGVVRTAGDVLAINGVKHPTLSSAIAKFIIQYEKGKYGSLQSGAKDNKPTNKEIEFFVSENPLVSEIAEVVMKEYHRFRLLPPSMVGGMYFVFNKINVTDTEFFFEKLIHGIDLSLTCPIKKFRDRLIMDSANKSKLPLAEKVKLMVATWNHYRKGSEIKNLKAATSQKLVAI